MTARATLAACLALAAACSDARRGPQEAGPVPDGPPPDRGPRDAASIADSGGARCEPLDLGAPAGDGDAGWPTCCTPALCAQIGQRCNAQTCRCELVRCATVGQPCDPAQLPGVCGDLVCAAAPAGAFCFVRVWSLEDCPPRVPFCSGGIPSSPNGCLCGLGCRAMLDDCPAGEACNAKDLPATLGTCMKWSEHGVVADGELCDNSQQCGQHATCTRAVWAGPAAVCARVDCGVAEGAPACPSGQRCLPLDDLGLLGMCRTACDPFRLGGCTPEELCLWHGEPGASAAYCERVGASPLPSRGAACTRWCAAGSACVEGRCLTICERGADAAAAGYACPAGYACAALDRVAAYPPAGGRVGACVQACDPWTQAASGCDAASYCAVSFDGRQVVGGCLTRRPDQPARGDPCSWWGFDCDAGLVCSGGTTSRCRPACLAGAAPGTPGACAAGERCFGIADPVRLVLLPYGFCAQPCEPGASGCARGVWCEPRELDPATGRWVGTCDEAS